jgi:hypothetical protein
MRSDGFAATRSAALPCRLGSYTAGGIIPMLKRTTFEPGSSSNPVRSRAKPSAGALATSQGALPLDIPFEPLGWFAISSAALRAARTAMQTRNENRIRVLGRIAV